jgi:hypothetical protein
MNTTQIRLATLATLALAATLHADAITGSVRLTPNLTHLGNNPAAQLVETIADVWQWAGSSSQLGTGTTATAMSLIYAQSTNIAAGATNVFDLAGGLVDSFGKTLTFARVKFLMLAPSNSMAVAQSVLVIPASENGFSTWQSGTTSAARVYSGGAWAIMAPCTNAYAVTGGTGDLLWIVNESTNAASYRLYIGGE